MICKYKQRSFTLIELILVVGIVALLAGLMIPFINSAKADAQAAKILQMIDVIKFACIKYYSDTGRYAYDLGDMPSGGCLSINTGWKGWDGPYLSRPLYFENNPYKLYFSVFDITDDFDLDGDGTLDKISCAGPVGNCGNTLYIYAGFPTDPQLPEPVKKRIDEVLDKGVPGDWKVTGRGRVMMGIYYVIYIQG